MWRLHCSGRKHTQQSTTPTEQTARDLLRTRGRTHARFRPSWLPLLSSDQRRSNGAHGLGWHRCRNRGQGAPPLWLLCCTRTFSHLSGCDPLGHGSIALRNCFCAVVLSPAFTAESIRTAVHGARVLRLQNDAGQQILTQYFYCISCRASTGPAAGAACRQKYGGAQQHDAHDKITVPHL